MAAGPNPRAAADAEQLAADWRACEKAAAAFDEETNTGGDGAAAEENALRNVDAKRVAALAELADRPALAGRAAAGAIQRRKRSLADRAAAQMLFALALREDDDGPDAGAVVPVSRRRAPFCWRKRDVAAAATAAASLKSLAGDASLADAWADAVLARICARSDARHRARGSKQCPESTAASMASRSGVASTGVSLDVMFWMIESQSHGVNCGGALRREHTHMSTDAKSQKHT